MLELLTLEFGEEPLINGRQIWLATIRNVRTKLLNLNEDIFIPELSF